MSRHSSYLAVLLVALLPTIASAATYRIEAESAGKLGMWDVADLPEASGGKVLAAGLWDVLGESNRIPASFPMPGRYAVWVRYHKLSTDCSAFYMLLRDEDGEAVAYLRCDFVPLMPTETPWRAVQTPATGFVWERMDVTI